MLYHIIKTLADGQLSKPPAHPQESQNLPSKITAVNVIAGFLGAGKTSAIVGLLNQKPANESWAVIVNEFGEIGIDGSFLRAQAKDSNVIVLEVPGGCMCCSAAFSMDLALSQILHLYTPDRLLIEPTGLGHPIEILQTLSAEAYKDTLSIQQTIAIVDAQAMCPGANPRHPNFDQHLAIADLIVANKSDLYGSADYDLLERYVRETLGSRAEIAASTFGRVDITRLEGASTWKSPGTVHRHADAETLPSAEQPIPECGFLQAENQGEGFASTGWRIRAEMVFSYARLFAFLRTLKVERMKAIFITEQGIFAYNMVADVLQEAAIDDCMESRIEIIAELINPHWEASLLNCLLEVDR